MSQKAELARVVHYESHPANTLVLREGDPGHCFFFIISGKVAVHLVQSNKCLQELSKGGPSTQQRKKGKKKRKKEKKRGGGGADGTKWNKIESLGEGVVFRIIDWQ